MTDEERAEFELLSKEPIRDAGRALEIAARLCDLSCERWHTGSPDEQYSEGYETGCCDALTFIADDIRALKASICDGNES